MYYSVFFITQNRLGQIFQDYKLQFLLLSCLLKVAIKRLIREMPSSSINAGALMYWSRWFLAPVIYIHGNVWKEATVEGPMVPIGYAGGMEANVLFLSFSH